MLFFKNALIYTSTPQYAFMAWCSVKAQGQLYLLPLHFTSFNLCVNLGISQWHNSFLRSIHSLCSGPRARWHQFRWSFRQGQWQGACTKGF